MKNLIVVLFFAFITVQLFSQNNDPTKSSQYSIFAESKNQWTGITISHSGRVFVNFPRWSANTPVSVAEIVKGNTIPYPNSEWNNWDKTVVRKGQFICVQSVYIDDLNFLWVLDTGQEPKTDSTKAAHLYVFNLDDNSLKNEYILPADKISGKSYLNDLQVDTKKQIVYLSDSDIGGIVILDLRTNEIRRVLGKHYSTLAEVPKITIEGYEKTRPVHSDGIALDPGRKYLYYSSLMGENVYRIPTKALLDKNIDEKSLGLLVEKFAKTGANDGIIFDKKGNLYLSSLEKNGISKLDSRSLINDKTIGY